MDRKQFLRVSGLVLLGIIGANKVIAILDNADELSKIADSKRASHGFGSSKFGA